MKLLLKKSITFLSVFASLILFNACEDDFPPTGQSLDPTVQPVVDPMEEMMSMDIEGRGQLVSSELLFSRNVQEVEELLPTISELLPLIIDVTNGIDYHKIVYQTIGLDGQLTEASGAVAVPTGFDGSSPIATYCHGTSILESNIPSAINAESNIGVIFASEGFVVTMPDYLGFGASEGFHPYHHANSTASTTVDMIRATKQMLDLQSVDYSDQLFIFGYSQGGHSAMATVKAIEEFHADELPITAAAPMSGAYDLAGVQATTFEQDIAYGAPYYLPYILLAYNEVYKVYPSTSDFLKSPWDEMLPPLFDGYHSPAEVNAIMPEIPNDIILDSVFDAFLNNPNHIFRQMLRDNSLLNFTPSTPLKIFYCNGDPLVLYQNSELACETYIANGATDIECIDGGPLDHGGCVLPSLIGARGWFKSLVE